MRPVAKKNKIEDDLRRFLGTVTDESGPRRFHLQLRLGEREHGISVRCNPGNHYLRIVGVVPFASGDIWNELSPEAFLDHQWVGQNILQLIPSKVTEKEIIATLEAARDEPVCASLYDDNKFAKVVMDATELQDRLRASSITIIEFHHTRHIKYDERQIATDAWVNVIEGIMNRAWTALCNLRVVRTAQPAQPVERISGFEKSMLSNKVRDAFSHCDGSYINTRVSVLTDLLNKWIGKVCAPYLEFILSIDNDAHGVLKEVDHLSKQLDVLKPFMDVVFFSIDSMLTKGTNATGAKKVSDLINEGARQQLYQPCYQHIAKATLLSIEDCRLQSLNSQINGVVTGEHFLSLKQIFPPGEYQRYIVEPCQKTAKSFAAQDGQAMLAKVRSGDALPQDYAAHVFRQARIERDIANALGYSFDTAVGQRFYASYVGTSKLDDGPLRQVLAAPNGVSLIFSQLTQTAILAGDVEQRCKLEALALLLGAANLPVPASEQLPASLLPTESYQGDAEVVIKAAVETIFDGVHLEFDAAVAAERGKAAEAAAPGAARAAEGAANNDLLKNYVASLIEQHKRLNEIVAAVDATLATDSHVYNLLLGANAPTGCAWGRDVTKTITSTFVKGLGSGIEASFTKRTAVTKTDAQDSIAREVEVCIATFVDHACRGSIKDVNVEELLTAAIGVGKYVGQLDLLQSELQHRCSRRLLAKQTPNDMEAVAINTCRRVFGQNFCHKMEKNMSDLEGRSRYNTEFEAWATRSNITVPATFLVLTSAHWKISTAKQWRLPAPFAAVTSHFERWFHEQAASKKLEWVVPESTGEVSIEYPQGKMVAGSVPHMAILLKLSGTGSRGLTLQELSASCVDEQIPEAKRLPMTLNCVMEIRRYTKPPLLSVTQPTNGKPVDPTQQVVLAQKFVSAARKFVIQRANEKRITTTEELGKDREVQMECAIVRIMKTRRTLTFREIFVEVVQQISHRFEPKERDVKKRVDDLIAREYLRRGEPGDLNLHYVA